MPKYNSVKEFIVSNFAPDVEAGDLADDFDLVDSGLINSLALLRLIAWVGDRYAIDVAEIDIDPSTFRTTAAIERFIEQHAPAKPGIH
ncbi:hypothetical protein [Nocardia sp. NPDC059239]|uniref:hypothetical protein n=1 Tax=Nocardia sp. NPDC059239 TaxID=3346785 RepID=UPI0036C30303